MRLRRAGIIAALTVLAVLIGAPGAHATELPSPVTPSDALPSTVVKMTQGKTGTWSVGDYLRAFTYANQERSLATIPKAVPLTAPAAVTRGAAGSNVVTGSFMAGWLLTDGYLAMYANITGESPMEGACAQPAWAQAVISTLYVFSSPDCSVKVANQNSDIVAGTQLSYGGTTLRDTGLYVEVLGGYNCWQASGPIPSGTRLEMRASGASSWGQTSWPTAAGASGYSCNGKPWQAAYPGVRPLTFRLVSSTTSAVLAQSATASADPSRSVDCRIRWSDGTTTTNAAAEVYKDTSGLPISVVSNSCQQAYVSKPGRGTTLYPTDIEVGSTNTDNGARTVISDQEVPEYTEQQRNGIYAPGVGGLVLQKIAGLDAGSCMTWAADCSDWWNTSQQGTNEDTYRCTFDGAAVELAECGIYRHTFDTRTGTPTITDPSTGEQTEWTSKADPANGYDTGGQAAQSPDRCVTSFSLNPVDWVLRPLRCAFEPRKSKVDEFGSRIDSAWRASFPAKLGGVFAGLGAAFGTVGAGGCQGLTVQVPTLGPDWKPVLKTAQYLPACPGDPFEHVAPAFFWIISAGIVIIGGIGIKLQLDKLVNNT